jgi:hypothetical protein
MRWSLLRPSDQHLFQSGLTIDCDPIESEGSPQVSRKACENVLCVLGRAVLSLLILAFSAVRYGLHERLRVQAAQANEVKRSVHAQGLYHHLGSTYASP